MSDKFTIKVFFRGDWCPWCNAYLRDFNGHLASVQALGGRIVGITSQAGNQSAANNDLSFEVIVDEENVEAKKYDIAVTPKSQSPLADAPDVYPNGMVQPGVVIEDASGVVLYRWAIVPSEMNFGGATDRPIVDDIIAALESVLAGGAGPDAPKMTDLAYLEAAHPDIHEIVKAFLAKMAADKA